VLGHASGSYIARGHIKDRIPKRQNVLNDREERPVLDTFSARKTSVSVPPSIVYTYNMECCLVTAPWVLPLLGALPENSHIESTPCDKSTWPGALQKAAAARCGDALTA
jgi:hypothetical protein